MKKEEIKELLDEEIANEIKDLSQFNSGTEEKSQAVNDLAVLYKLKIEETKVGMDFDEKRERRKMDKDIHLKDGAFKEQQIYNDNRVHENDDRIKRDQLAEQVKDRYMRLGIAAAEIILPLIFYSVWMKRGFKFEEEGTYTSTTFKGLFNKFKPTKK